MKNTSHLPSQTFSRTSRQAGAFLLGAMTLLSAVCMAQTAGVFERYDKNSDGRVNRDELPNRAIFAQFDLDADGAITRAEYEKVASGENSEPRTGKAAMAQIDALAREFDRDGDGRITRAEAGGAKWFGRVDLDADGVIDAKELAQLRALVGGGRGMPEETPPSAASAVPAVTSGPEPLHPGEAGIGRMIADAAFTDLKGVQHRLSQLRAEHGLVIAMTSATCPVSKRYLPSLAALEKELAAHDIPLLLVNPFASEKPEEIAAKLAAHSFSAPYVHDREKALSTALQARTTTEVFLIDSTGTLVYRGALDDQFGIDYNRDAPAHTYLKDAVAAMLKRAEPPVAATAAPGCELDTAGAATAQAGTVTYHRDVARILQQNCVTCHREGGIAPFALDTLDDVTDRAKVIKRVITEGTMPPWFAAGDESAKDASPWANDCSLAARDKADLLAWIESADRPLGDAAEAPLARAYPSEWSIGTPDLIVPLSRAYDIKATGFMPYQFDVVQTDLTEDKWVSAFEILPSARDVVHHVIVQVHEKGSTVRDRAEGTDGYWASYVPGNGHHHFPEGCARKLPAGARISFQIHYTPSGVAKKERLRLGLVFAEKPPQYEVRTLAVANHKIAIPPGAANHIETRSQRVPVDAPVASLLAHMHVRGKAFKFELTHPDGRTETLLDIPRYDFNWQLRYDYKQPKILPRGSTVTITAAYDNSPANQANPDPAKLVKWGAQTHDEMMIGYFEYLVPVEAKVAVK